MSHTIQDKFNIGCGFLGGTLIVPALGILAHIITGINVNRYPTISDPAYDNYSLRNRFECAYCFDVPRQHKTYYQYYAYKDEFFNIMRTYAKAEPYIASPWATYPATLIAGTIGAMAVARTQKKKKTHSR